MNNEQKHSPKWRREPEKRPNDILDGALIEFRTRGFVGARIEDIAKHAGLSKGAVYLYFSSKEEMLKALVRRSVTPIAEKVSKIADHVNDGDQTVTASEILKKMLLTAGDRIIAEKTRAIPLLIISEAGNFPELAKFYRDEVIDVIMSAMATVLSKGIESGEFKNVNIKLAMQTLMGVMMMQIIWEGVFARENEPQTCMADLMNSHVDIFLNGIVMPQET